MLPQAQTFDPEHNPGGPTDLVDLPESLHDSGFDDLDIEYSCLAPSRHAEVHNVYETFYELIIEEEFLQLAEKMDAPRVCPAATATLANAA
jgi:hypothetical protein